MNALPETLRTALATREVFTEDGSKIPLRDNVDAGECLRLYETVRALRPACSVEVGFAQGMSTLAILQAIHDNGVGHHHVIDPFQSSGYANCGRAMVRQAGLEEHMTFHEKFAEEVIPALPRLQFAFIDSSHVFDLTVCEFVLIDKRLDVEGCLGFHDLWMPALRSVVRYILNNRKYVVREGQSAEHAPGSLLPKIARSIARCLPKRDLMFTQEFLKPWRAYGLPNMLFLRKTAEAERKWDDFAAF